MTFEPYLRNILFIYLKLIFLQYLTIFKHLTFLKLIFTKSLWGQIITLQVLPGKQSKEIPIQGLADCGVRFFSKSSTVPCPCALLQIEGLLEKQPALQGPIKVPITSFITICELTSFTLLTSLKPVERVEKDLHRNEALRSKTNVERRYANILFIDSIFLNLKKS